MEEQDGAYTRYSAKIQRGDGVDRRGDIQVEMVREHPESLVDTTRHTVELPNGREVKFDADDRAFAEFYFSLQRAEGVLTETLGLDESPDEE